jgi:hypothetical protein
MNLALMKEFAHSIVEDCGYRDTSGARNRDGRLYCNHCGEDIDTDSNDHTEDCLVTRAQNFLKEQSVEPPELSALESSMSDLEKL